MRLIDGDELYRKVTGYQDGAVDKSVAKRLIEQMPTFECNRVPLDKSLDYISRDMTIKMLFDGFDYVDNESFGYLLAKLKTLPAADVVEVVRCKDCKYRNEAECPMYHEEDIEWDDDGYIERDTIYHDWTEDDGFCERGERRTDG